jgi:hypothetical protein
MRGIKTVGASALALASLAAFATGAQATQLTLKSGGQAVPAGTAAVGTLRFGPCGQLTSTGTLMNNGAMADQATFSTFETSIGGCGEGGPIITGQLESITVSGNGMFTATGTISYKTTLMKTCEYSLTRLKGKFTIPGPTTANLAGTAKRVKAGSQHGCKGAVHLTMEEASLNDQETGKPFEAES